MRPDLEQVKRDHSIIDELARRGIRPARNFGNQVTYRCPLPDHDDHDPSFIVYKDTNTFKCYGCDRRGSIIDLIVALDNRDYKDVIAELMGGEGGYTPSRNTATLQHPSKTKAAKVASKATGCTIEALAAKCGLPADHLRSFGLSDMSYMSTPAVRIPYLDTDGHELAVQYRIALEKPEVGDRFRWKKGSRPTLYGWPGLEDARKAGYLVVCEGPSDWWTLQRHGFPALALPSATGWREEYAEALAGLDRVFCIIEPDDGGATVREAFKASKVANRVYLIYMNNGAKDCNALHKRDPDGFLTAFNDLLAHAVPLTREIRQEVSEEAAEAWSECQALAVEPNILELFARSIHARGVAGEERLSKIVYLALTSRFFERPISVALKGPSAGGKSFVIERVLDYFPEDAYYTLSAMSERALAYMGEPLQHRFLVIFEAAGMEGEMATYLIRSLLSEGCVKYATVEKTSEGLQEKLIEREGPTGLLVTTTRPRLHPENETRLLSLTVTDTPEQTKAVFMALAEEEEALVGDELQPWKALQRWLTLGGEHRVTVPYAKALAHHVPPVAVRLRRDFKMLLNLIKAHAVLHQETREADHEGRIIATLEDYAAVRGLVADLVADEVGATVGEATKETVRAVSALYADTDEPLNNKEIATKLNIDPASASRRLRVAAAKGYVRNLETKRGLAARWVPADPLPEDIDLLPLPEVLQCCSVDQGDRDPHPPTM